MNKLEKSTLLFIVFTFVSSLLLLYFRYNFSSVMPGLTITITILTILILLSVIITVVSFFDGDT